MDRLRWSYNWIHVKLRPIRRKLRDPKLRTLMLKWCTVGMLAYLFLYTAFYIIVRNNYLFGLDEESNGLLEQYSLDLKNCWHSNTEESQSKVNQPMEVSFHSVEALEAMKIHRQTKNRIRKVLVLPDENHKQDGAHIDMLLDAGMCIATHNANTNTKNKQSYLRSFSTPDSSATDTMTTIHTTTSTTSTIGTTNTYTNTASIDTTHYTTRCLPTFIIAGAMKCGTGELMKWLQLHPSLRVGSNNDKRELHYFTSISGDSSVHSTNTHHNHTHRRLQSPHNAYNTTNTTSATLRSLHTHTNTTHPTHIPIRPSHLAEYAQFFPAFSPAELNSVLTFEKSPDYIREPSALKLIYNYMPSMKIIILLRNPIVRALSEFSHHCRHGRYVRLLYSVSIGGVEYVSGSIVRIDVHNSGSSTGSGSNIFPEGSYEVLAYPCIATDAEVYFSGSAGYRNWYTTYTASSSSGGSTTNNTNADNTNTDSSTSSTSSTNTIPITTATHTIHTRLHHVPEIEHGMYDHQLAALYEIFPKEQVLVLLQEDMYRHTFRTLRQVEEFLKIGCFDYQAYSIIPTSSVMNKPLLDAQDTGDDAFTDDHYTTLPDTTPTTSSTSKKDTKNSHTRTSVSSSASTTSGNKNRKGSKHHVKPPRRAPQTLNEMMKHYKAELEQYLSSWKGLSMSTSTSLYDSTSPVFKEYLHSVYRSSNNKLSTLLHGGNNINYAFSRDHLIEMGWDMGE